MSHPHSHPPHPYHPPVSRIERNGDEDDNGDRYVPTENKRKIRADVSVSAHKAMLARLKKAKQKQDSTARARTGDAGEDKDMPGDIAGLVDVILTAQTDRDVKREAKRARPELNLAGAQAALRLVDGNEMPPPLTNARAAAANVGGTAFSSPTAAVVSGVDQAQAAFDLDDDNSDLEEEELRLHGGARAKQRGHARAASASRGVPGHPATPGVTSDGPLVVDGEYYAPKPKRRRARAPSSRTDSPAMDHHTPILSDAMAILEQRRAASRGSKDADRLRESELEVKRQELDVLKEQMRLMDEKEKREARREEERERRDRAREVEEARRRDEEARRNEREQAREEERERRERAREEAERDRRDAERDERKAFLQMMLQCMQSLQPRKGD